MQQNSSVGFRLLGDYHRFLMYKTYSSIPSGKKYLFAPRLEFLVSTLQALEGKKNFQGWSGKGVVPVCFVVGSMVVSSFILKSREKGDDPTQMLSPVYKQQPIAPPVW